MKWRRKIISDCAVSYATVEQYLQQMNNDVYKITNVFGEYANCSRIHFPAHFICVTIKLEL